MRAKDNAISFLHLVTSGRIREAYAGHVSPVFMHHNPYFKPTGPDLEAGMAENESKFPNKVLEIQHAVEERDLVAVHSKLVLSPQMTMAVVHLFRFENGKIAELWDIGQQVPEGMVNEKGMF